MKILIAGYGKVGETLAQQLSAEGNDITLMDSDPEVLAAGMEFVAAYDALSGLKPLEELKAKIAAGWAKNE